MRALFSVNEVVRDNPSMGQSFSVRDVRILDPLWIAGVLNYELFACLAVRKLT